MLSGTVGNCRELSGVGPVGLSGYCRVTVGIHCQAVESGLKCSAGVQQQRQQQELQHDGPMLVEQLEHVSGGD